MSLIKVSGGIRPLQNSRNKNIDEEKKREIEKTVIENLHSVLQENISYSLNSNAFSVHTANFRYDLIQSYFSQVGVLRIADRSLGFKDLTNQLAIRQQQEPTDEKLALKSWLEYELNELAQLRNEIAHGAFEGSIESVELLIERAQCLKQFGIALAEILFRVIKELVFNEKERVIIGLADRTFPKHNSFGFLGKKLSGSENRYIVKVGDQIFAKRNDVLISGSVKSLVLNGNYVTEIEYPNEEDSSIGVDFNVTNNMANRELSIAKRNICSS